MKRLKLLPMIIMLLAGLITCIIAVFKNFDNTYALTVLFIVLLIFYVIGLISRAIIKKVCFSTNVKNEEGEESATTEGENGENKVEEVND